MIVLYIKCGISKNVLQAQLYQQSKGQGFLCNYYQPPRELSSLLHCWVAAIADTIKLVEGVGGTAYGYRCDLADKEDVYKLARRTREEAGDVSSI